MKTRVFFAIAFAITLTVLLGIDTASAQINTTTPRVSARTVQRLITRIETKVEVLKDEADRVATRSGRQNQDPDSASDLGRQLDDLNASLTRLDDAMDTRQPIDSELRAAMSDATVVDQYMTQNRVSVAAQAQWRSLKRDFNTLAGYYRLSWNWNQELPGGPTTGGGVTGPRPYTVTDAQMQTLLSRIRMKTGIFKSQVIKVRGEARVEDFRNEPSLANYIAGFETATNRLTERVNAMQSTDRDLTDVMTQAAYIDQYMSRNDLPVEVEAQWRNLRGDLNTLANDYQVTWSWNQQLPPYPGTVDTNPIPGRGFDAALSGTYRLNTGMSEDVSTAIDRALSRNTNDQLQRERLERRLRSPEMLAIEKNNANVTMASSNQPRITFQADGVARAETNQNGRRITTTATADADGLIINYQGERANDFYVTFAPTNDGRLRVTRRIYIENTNQAVTVSSVYDKVDNVARWNMVTIGDTSGGVVNDSFIIPSGTRLNASLRTPIDSRTIQSNDRIALEVTTPTQYRGAVINGRVITEDATSRVAGRTRVLVSFDSIRLSNGQSYRFNGLVNGVISADGQNISVTQQTPARQTTRGNIGSILGALIGAVSGRPIEQTAATDTTGTILVESGDVFDLANGSQFIITSTSDATVSRLR